VVVVVLEELLILLPLVLVEQVVVGQVQQALQTQLPERQILVAAAVVLGLMAPLELEATAAPVL
jgi:hypothetical protein